jgi:hypothetical protein
LNNGKNTSLFVKIQVYFFYFVNKSNLPHFLSIVHNQNTLPNFAFITENIALMNKRTLAVLGQIDGTIPSTWEAQELENYSLWVGQ